MSVNPIGASLSDMAARSEPTKASDKTTGTQNVTTEQVSATLYPTHLAKSMTSRNLPITRLAPLRLRILEPLDRSSLEQAIFSQQRLKPKILERRMVAKKANMVRI